MRRAILAFAAGVLVLQECPELPAPEELGLLVLAGIGAAAWPATGVKRTLGHVLAGLLLGFAWAGLLAQHRLADALPEASEGRDIEIVGVVATLPQRAEHGIRFAFDVERSAEPVPSRISLAWYRGWRPQDDDDFHVLPAVQPGERWRLCVRLKRPHASLNPHGFDFEAWLFEQDLRATGYVRANPTNARLDEWAAGPGYLVERLRAAVRGRFQRVLGDAPCAGILMALAIGDQQAIEPGLWRVFARTGVTHLLSVSGLHVTMVAGLAAWLAGWAWRRSPGLMLRLPAQKAAALAGVGAAFAYCLLAGFAVPAQRTLYMLAVVAVALWTGRTTAVSRVLALALLMVLLLDPWAVSSAGFWLSFGAVGLLFYIGTGRLGEGRRLAAWARAQWAVTVGMVPALLALFQQFSLVSPFANAVAIPVVSLLVTPLALLGALPLADPLLWLAHAVTVAVMALLDWLAASPWAVWQQQAPPFWAVLLGIAGVGWLLLPRGVPARWLGALALLPAVLVMPARPAPGEVVATVLDVGQGLAVHVQTANHDLLYDTGPAYSADADAGSRIVVPYLRAGGVRRLDELVVSHADQDHAGGAISVVSELPVGALLTSVGDDHPLARLPVPRRRCRDGERWQWDGVEFTVLHPAEDAYVAASKSNALSCVVRIAAAGGSLLLTGDIEARDEALLLARHPEVGRTDVVLPAHHGSRSSSSNQFVLATAPSLAVISAGYRNRFGHPAKEVIERYVLAGSQIRRTDREGAVIIALASDGVVTTTERERRRRYWQGR